MAFLNKECVDGLHVPICPDLILHHYQSMWSGNDGRDGFVENIEFAVLITVISTTGQMPPYVPVRYSANLRFQQPLTFEELREKMGN